MLALLRRTFFLIPFMVYILVINNTHMMFDLGFNGLNGLHDLISLLINRVGFVVIAR